MDKKELNQIINKSVELQKMLYNRLQSETKQVDREWTAYQIAYQKGIHKRASYMLTGCVVLDGIKMASELEVNEYFLHLI